MKKIICLLTVIVIVFSLCGCSAVEQLQSWKNDNETATDGVSSQTETPSTATGEDKLVVALEEPQLTDDNSREVVLFFADKSGEKLQKELRRILKSEGLAKSTLEELLKGPANADLTAVTPDGARLLSLNIKDGLATADFNSALREAGGATGELLTVYAIVNTLTQFNSVEQVQLLIDGAKVETLAGHVDISEPLTRDVSLVGE